MSLAFPIQQSVIDFHEKYGHPVRNEPQTIEEGEALQAYGFIEEEVEELYAALYLKRECECEDIDGCPFMDHQYRPDLTEIADALGDIVFTAYGMAARHGIDLDRVLAAIVYSNNTKEANGLGKIRKGADYKAPDIAGALTI